MTSTIKACTIAILFACLLASCMKDTETITYNDAEITAFTLNGLKVYSTNASTGEKYSYTYSATRYPMHIDQINGKIYNEDALIYNTDLKHVLVNVTTKNSGTVLIKNMDNDEFSMYIAADSIDFSQERTFRVVAYDYSHVKDYAVKLTVQQEDADSFTWVKMPVNNAIAAMKQVKGIYFNDKSYLIGNDGTTVSLLSTNDGTAWDACSLPAGTTTSASIAAFDGKMLLLDNNNIYTSTDGSNWSAPVATSTPLKTILGGCKYTDTYFDQYHVNELYAISADGKIVVSADNGATWKADSLEMGQDNLGKDVEKNVSNLPVSNVSFLTRTSKTNKDITNATIIGTSANASQLYSVVWHKTVDPHRLQPWMYVPVQNGNNLGMPKLNSLSVIAYANNMIAVGLNPSNGATLFYYSVDNGITWYNMETLKAPTDNTDPANPVKFSAQDGVAIIPYGDKHFFLVGTGSGEVWRCHQNKQLWEEKQKYFE